MMLLKLYLHPIVMLRSQPSKKNKKRKSPHGLGCESSSSARLNDYKCHRKCLLLPIWKISQSVVSELISKPSLGKALRAAGRWVFPLSPSKPLWALERIFFSFAKGIILLPGEKGAGCSQGWHPGTGVQHSQPHGFGFISVGKINKLHLPSYSPPHVRLPL